MNTKELTREEVRKRAVENNDQDTLRRLDLIEEAQTVIKRLDRKKSNRKAGETRGGARPGAGAPAKMGEPATERLAFRITPTQAAALDDRMQEGESRNQAARRLLLDLLEREES